jgi:gliding motility-associated-like protein
MSQQANNWYFGDHAGLSFSTSPPTALLNGAINTNEGCASVSNASGNLLFYTDGVTIWNKNHVPMLNGTGFMGHESSTHSAIVIPKPGTDSIYYVFTADADENNYIGGYRYSEVNMNLDGGLGGVTTIKNILLYAPCTEKLTASSHANGIDIWVITKELNNHTFRSYKVTCNGVETTPVISNVDPKNGSLLGYRTGCIKVSPDGSKLASARYLEGKFDVFRFNNATGVISDRIMITQAGAITLYGVEFSPNSNILYVNGTYTYQYKVDIHDSIAIRNSIYQVDNVVFLHPSIQLGPDGKVYSNTFPNTSYINNPNVAGVGCDYREQAIPLGGRNGKFGLPTFFNRLVTNYNLDFNFTIRPDCKTVDFTGVTNIPGVVDWNWDFGDGNTGTGQNVTHIFPSTSNTFTVRLTVNNPNVCGGSATRTRDVVFDRVAPTASFFPTSTCGSKTVSFTNQSTIPPGGTIFSYFWEFGDGNTSTDLNPIHTYTTYNNYTAKLTVTSADFCRTTDIKTLPVIVKDNPVVNFSVNNGCYDKVFTFTNNTTIENSSITSWLWNFGDGNTSNAFSPSHTYASPNTYTVTLTATSNNNCTTGPFPKTVIAGAKPVVSFDAPLICLLDAIANFNNTTTISDGSTLSYLWNFDDPNASPGNPNTSTLQHPSHTYSAAALYQVKLITSTNYGCVDSVTNPFSVNGAVPKAKFTVENSTPLCSNADVVIKDSSYVDFGNITKVIIDWGDGNITTDNNPGQMPNGHTYTHRYAIFGTPATRQYTINMTSYSGTLCVNNFPKTITIHASPEIRFDPISDICNEAPPFIITQASEIWGVTGIGTYSGNGITNANGTFNPTLAGAGSHLITYSFISNFGCRADSIKLITVNPTPLSAFSKTYGCLPDAAVAFRSDATILGGGALQHLWNFGDPLAGPGNPNTSTAINPTHIYRVMNTYDVTLTTTSAKGCSHDTLIKVLPNIDIYTQPTAEFKVDSSKAICAGSPVYFINQSNGAGYNINLYQWDFADGNTSNAINPNNTYNTHRDYDVTLWVQNEKGCKSSTTTHKIIVHSLPKADFKFDSTCFGKPVQFFDRSTNALGDVTIWNWNLGINNNSTSTLQNPIATYSAYKPFTASLQVATANKCVSTVTQKTFTIRKVNVNAGRDTSIAKGQPLQLQANGASTYTWTPSTGLNKTNIYNPIATLFNTNEQMYYLQGITTEGCYGFDTINIKVFNKADVYMPNAFTPNGDGLNDYLQPILIGVKQLNYFIIYDRWGNTIFSTKNQYDKWNGKFNGQTAEPGSYVWVAEANTFNGVTVQRKGSVMLIR